MKKKEQPNKHGLGSAPSARKGVCDTLHSPYICRLSQAFILRETSSRATRNANSSLTVFPHCLLLLTVLSLDCYLKLTVLLSLVDWPSVSSLGPSLPLPVSWEISSSGPLFGFRTKADRDSLIGVPPPHTHTEWPQCHIYIVSSIPI